MQDSETLKRCTEKLGMSTNDAQWVLEHLYDYAMPNFSEWSWAQIDECFRDVLWFKDKTDAEIEEALCAS